MTGTAFSRHLADSPSGALAPDGGEDLPEHIVIIESDDGELEPEVDKKSGALKIPTEDGGLVIDFGGPKAAEEAGDFNANLALTITDMERRRIAAELLQQIQSDENSRSEWLENRAKGMEMLGFKLEEPRGDAGGSTAPVEGMSTVRHPMLPEAVIRFQSNASAELLPAGGPVKVLNYGTESGVGDELAEALEKDLNFYLCVVDKGYRADTNRALFSCGFGGCSFKKVYADPIRRMPLSRMVDAADLIVSNNVNDFDDAGRITHRIIMRPSVLRRMQLAGVYRDIDLSQPYYQPNAVEEKTAEIQGMVARPDRPEDMPYTIYESYCELDIQGFEHEQDGKPSHLPLPYRVVVDKDSQEILEIRRNWREDDENCLPRRVFVKYPFVPAFGFYEIGMLQILGNANKALTGAWRIMLDSGMFATFPGFLYADVAGRQVTNEFRVPPGGGVKIQTGGNPIGDVVMPLPYKTEGMQALLGLSKSIEEMCQRLGGIAELQVLEGKQEAPVGTTLALIEQAGKMLAYVHVGLHAAQAEEFQLLKELFRDDPEALWRQNRRPSMPAEARATFLQALDNFDIVPAADPNVPSHMHRVMKAVAIKQMQAMNPQLYDGKAVDTRILRMIGISDPESLFAPPAPPQAAPEAPAIPTDPNKMAALQQKEQQQQRESQQQQAELAEQARQSDKDHQHRMAEIGVESADRAADRQSHERVAGTKLLAEQVRNQQQDTQAQQKLAHEANQQGIDRFLGLHQQHQENLTRQQQMHPIPQSPSSQPANPSGHAEGGAITPPKKPLWPQPI